MTPQTFVSAPAEPRFLLARTSPAVHKALVSLQLASVDDVDPVVTELIKIRASQINGCAYCLHMHTSDATKLGIDVGKQHMVLVWREARHFFTEREQAALEFTEVVTRLGDHGVPDATIAFLREHYTDREISQLLSAIVMINAWNRVAVASGRIAGTDERK